MKLPVHPEARVASVPSHLQGPADVSVVLDQAAAETEVVR